MAGLRLAAMAAPPAGRGRGRPRQRPHPRSWSTTCCDEVLARAARRTPARSCCRPAWRPSLSGGLADALTRGAGPAPGRWSGWPGRTSWSSRAGAGASTATTRCCARCWPPSCTGSGRPRCPRCWAGRPAGTRRTARPSRRCGRPRQAGDWDFGAQVLADAGAGVPGPGPARPSWRACWPRSRRSGGRATPRWRRRWRRPGSGRATRPGPAPHLDCAQPLAGPAGLRHAPGRRSPGSPRCRHAGRQPGRCRTGLAGQAVVTGRAGGGGGGHGAAVPGGRAALVRARAARGCAAGRSGGPARAGPGTPAPSWPRAACPGCGPGRWPGRRWPRRAAATWPRPAR